MANQKIQQYQGLLSQLQTSGLITIGSDGTVTANQPAYNQPLLPPFENHPERTHQ